MKVEKEFKIGDKRFELAAFRKFRVGSTLIILPGYQVYCLAYGDDDELLWEDFLKTPQGEPIIYQTPEAAFNYAERMLWALKN